MIRDEGDFELFEAEIILPDTTLAQHTERLIGFEERFARLGRAMAILLDPDSLDTWARRFHGEALPLVAVMADRYPLVVLHGDVGTGKTAFAEGAADRLCRATRREGTLLKLSTRVRGVGQVGQISHLINQAFTAVETAAAGKRAAVLLIDEADSLAASRDQLHSHHEDKVAVNTLIQKIDDVRRLGGRLLVILCTNRIAALDAALLRRAALQERFDRPDDSERAALLLEERLSSERVECPPRCCRSGVGETGCSGGEASGEVLDVGQSHIRGLVTPGRWFRRWLTRV